MRAVMASTVVAGSLALSACSGAPSDITAIPGGDGAAVVVTAYARALADGDGARACSLASLGLQQNLVAQTSSRNCLDSVRSIAGRLAANKGAGTLRGLEILDTTVTENGQLATIRIDAASSEYLGGTYVTVLRDEQHWQVENIR
jgi:hypothetical protein